MKNTRLKIVIPIVLLVLSAAMISATIDADCTDTITHQDCGLCEKCNAITLKCEYQSNEQDLKRECFDTRPSHYIKSCLTGYLYNYNAGFCDGAGACLTDIGYVQLGRVCIDSTHYDVLPTEQAYCDIWKNCVAGETSASEYYIGYSPATIPQTMCSDKDIDGIYNWVATGTIWFADPGNMIGQTEHAPVCSQMPSSCARGSTKACGSGICLGTQTCKRDGTWGDCSTSGIDAGICAKCDTTGTPVYASTQNADCTATTCPASGCGVDACGTNIWGNFPLSVANQCSAIYTCTQNTCTGKATCQADADKDSYSAKCGDCNDNDAARYPGAAETCDGKDNNCNGQIDENLVNSCGTGLCAGTSICTRGVWGKCSTSGIDAGICAKCDTTGTPVYASAQNADCTATICPADGCGVDTCALNMWGNYPASVANKCSAIYTCTQNTCAGKAICKLAPKKCK